MNFVGVDPGLTGAVGVLDHQGAYVDCFDCPTTLRSKRARVKYALDPVRLYQQLKQSIDQGSVALLEWMSSRPQQGVASTFSLGESFGVVRSVLSLLPLSVECVIPTVWKRFFSLLGRDKTASRDLLSTNALPQSSLTPSKRP